MMPSSFSPQQTTQQIRDLLANAGAPVDLCQLALLACRFFRSDAPVQPTLDYIDEVAGRVRGLIQAHGKAGSPCDEVGLLSHVLFREEGFYGDEEDYYSPANSFLDQVVERKRGIPITLSTLYIGVGVRAGIDLHGVALPLHFVVRHAGADDLFVDVYHRGKMLTAAQCEEAVSRSYGAAVHVEPACFEPAAPEMVLHRLLNNLKYAYIRRDNVALAGDALSLMLETTPCQPTDLRDRGLLYAQERRWREALETLGRYVTENPDASDRDLMMRRIEDYCQARARNN